MYINSGNDIYIRPGGAENGIKVIGDGAVELYHDGSTYGTPKIKTSTTGITVDGEVATTQDYPTQRATLDFNFAAERKLDPRITYTRTGNASFTDKLGKVVLVGEDAPRFDHDPTTRESKGLLLEESRTNIIYPSSDWSSANYTHENNNTSREPNTTDTEDPAGTFNATKITPEQGVSTLRSIYWGTNITFTNTVKFTMSAFAKSTTGLHIQLRPRGQGSNKAWATFNLTTGVVGNSGGTVLVSTKIEKYPNDWYRCYLTFTGGGDTGGGFGALIMDDGNDAEAATHSGDASKSIFFWGAQFETGSFATSYIPTNGATQARGQDLVEITEEEFSEFYNRTEGSFVSEIMIKPSFPVSGYATVMMSLSDSSYNNRVTLSSSTGSAAFNADVTIGGTNNRAVLGSYTSGSHSIKAAMAYKAGDSAGSLNGAEAVTTSPSGTLPLLTRADIGKDHVNFNPLNGHIKRIMYYSKRLSNNQLRTLTS